LNLCRRLSPELGLAVSEVSSEASTSAGSEDEGLVLKLMRHAARLSRFVKQEVEFPLRVHADSTPRSEAFSRFDEFDGIRVDKLLDDGPKRLVIVGYPGAGKTYAVWNSAARISELLHESLLSDLPSLSDAVVPIIVDLKLYAGDLKALAEKAIPAGLSLSELHSRVHLKFYLDAFNEMPQRYIENGDWEPDFSSFLKSMENAYFAITSRTKDVLAKLELPTYLLDELDEEFVVAQLNAGGAPIADHLGNEVVELLQKPFYFRLVSSGRISLSAECQPKDIYAALFLNLASAFKSRFANDLDLELALSLSAYESIERGEEALPISEFSNFLQPEIDKLGTHIDTEDLINWLVAQNILVPYSGARLAFFHQSVTEYLAAKELAQRYVQTPQILREKLRWRRWDQALFLTLSFLPDRFANAFIEEVIEIDFGLALQAVRYVEAGSEPIVHKLLERIPQIARKPRVSDTDYGWQLSSLPVRREHATALKKVIKLGDSLGGTAASLLFEIEGPDVRDELLELLVSRCDDYNFCTSLARTLAPIVSDADLPTLVTMADQVQSKLKRAALREYQGFDSALGIMLGNVDPELVCEAFLDKTRPFAGQQVRLAVIHDALREQSSSKALAVAGGLLISGDDEAVISLSFITGLRHEGLALDWALIDQRHLDKCTQLLSHEQFGQWALNVLGSVCKDRSDFRKRIFEQAASERGVLRACLLFASEQDDSCSEIFEALAELLRMNTDEMSSQPFATLDYLQLNWHKHEPLFVALLQLRYRPLAVGLLESVYVAHGSPFGILDIGPIHWWLEWLLECAKEQSNDSSSWLIIDRLTHVLAEYVSAETRAEYVAEFNNPTSAYREVLASDLLPKVRNITTDDFREDAISYLLALLSKHGEADLISGTATESFVEEQLMPLVPKVKGRVRKGLVAALRSAGRRHGKRYIPE
jgi:hypothetical protein